MGVTRETLISSHLTRKPRVFRRCPNRSIRVLLMQAPPTTLIDTGVRVLEPQCLDVAWRGHVWVTAWDRVWSQRPGHRLHLVWRTDPRAVLCPVTCIIRTE